MKRLKNKRGQIESIFYFFAIVFIIFLTAPLFLKISTDMLSHVEAVGGNISSTAGGDVKYLKTSMNNLWDEMIVLLFFGNIMLLLVSAFLVDVHPLFVILYIIGLVMLFVFAMPIWDVLNQIYSGTGAGSVLSTQTNQMALTKFIIDYFGIILLGVVILSGIIMYAKFKFFGGGNGNY